MAKAQKTSKPGSSKEQSSSSDPTKVEDAVVVSETAPDPVIAAVEEQTETPAQDQRPEPDAQKGPVGKPPITQQPKSDAPKSSGPAGSAPSVNVQPTRKSGGAAFAGFLFGGVAAAAIGFAAARYVVPEGWPFPGVTPEPDPLALAVEAQAVEIGDLAGRIGSLEASVTALQADTRLDSLEQGLGARFDALGADLEAIGSRLDGFESRLSAVERLAPEGSAAAQMAAEAYAKELAELRTMFQAELAKVDAAEAEAAALQVQAADAARAEAGRAALARIVAALDTGVAFGDALAELSEATGIAAPGALAQVAVEGVPTLGALQEAFPPAARAALDASVRAAVEAGEMSRFAAFVQTQLGARSLEPKEGADADAILSRAEAALKSGDIAAALAELDSLPASGMPAMVQWRSMAETRKAALDAGAALAAELNAR